MKKNYKHGRHLMLKRMFSIAFLSLMAFHSFSQGIPDLLWEKVYPGNGTDITRQLISTNDGGYAIISESDSYGPGIISAYLIKCDSLGNSEWSKCYGGSTFDFPRGIIQTTDNGFLIATYSNSFTTDMIIRLIKVNEIGDTLWTSILPNSNGCNLTLAGCLTQTFDGGYMVAAYGWRPPNNNQIVIFKTDNEGNYEWFKEYGGSTNDDYGACIKPTLDGNYILAGYTYSFGSGLCDGYLIKIDPNGDTLWTSVVGGSSYDSFHFVQPTSDGGYIAVGSTQSYGNKEQGFTVKVDSKGKVEWISAQGGNQNEGFEGVVETLNHEYLITGNTSSYGNGQHDFIIVLMDDQGNMLDMKTYGTNGDDFGSTIEIMTDNRYIAGGSKTKNNSLDSWALCFKADSIVGIDLPRSSQTVISLEISPNPFYNQANIDIFVHSSGMISLNLFDMNGVKVDEIFDGYISAGAHSFQYKNASLSRGIYFCQLKIENQIVIKKVILL
ncbi:MAG TPA: T9SS type A sorting domain-containing protein [Bacteroidales bacterium]|jgi:hypothetical protein|nr:T9SS type A sorting domain-containing protein [Bacteroidales bacterium]MDI9573609.1 T9SS type A sorting domain-containing protein [Bacteroidota bacterium]MBP9511061.1 T9SS type A sorting domain-containing protein [Bacteroidales bacterium]MBP9588130.1 T9SS type A sorting domain-containing protein [Bacteroidales bacterium]HOE58200.1 T9SS type A sorting domain-containing protein [Bacteroidales bacterium]